MLAHASTRLRSLEIGEIIVKCFAVDFSDKALARDERGVLGARRMIGQHGTNMQSSGVYRHSLCAGRTQHWEHGE